LTESWTNLYKHGQNLNSVCKRFMTEFRKAVEEDNEDMMIIWGECLRKVTMNIVDVAKTVLGVEEIVKGKRVTN